jgi:tetratricopeptide (TPR) repeat protein
MIAVAAMALTAFGQAPAQKNWKDRAEYDLYDAITKDNTPASRLQSLDKWKAGYAQSDYADVRMKIYLVTYQQMQNHRAAFDTAQEILKTDPNDLTAINEIVGFGLTLVPADPKATLTPANKADLDAVEKTAHYVVDNSDKIFAADKKPQGTTDEQWAAARPTMQKFSQFTIARVMMAEKDTAKSETELGNTVKMDPTNAQASYMLAGNLLAQQKEHPDKMPTALFEYARAASYDGPGALDANTRKQIDAFLTKAYTTYHGSAQGLDQLKAAAKTSAMPPDGFGIKSTVDIAKEAEEKRQKQLKENPMVAFWNETKENLTGEKSAELWESNYKDAALPDPALGFTKFKGKLVSAEPETKPKTLTIALAGDAADVKIVLAEPLPGKMDPGGEISFRGALKEFSKDPYMLTFEVEAADVEGWTGKGPVPARGAGAATKKAAPAAAPAKKQ